MAAALVACCRMAASPCVADAQLGYATRVLDYAPGPGQFTDPNIAFVLFTDPNTALGPPSLLATPDTPSASPYEIVSLGDRRVAGGLGSITLGFDAPVVNQRPSERNPYGIDFVVFGNAAEVFVGSGGGRWQEPGIIEVAKDANGNGLADDEWYMVYLGNFAQLPAHLVGPSYDPNGDLVPGDTGHSQTLLTYYADVVPTNGPLIDQYLTTQEPNDLILDDPFTFETEGIGGTGVDVRWAVRESAPGEPILHAFGLPEAVYLDQIDFVRITDALELDEMIDLGEVSTEIDAIVVLPDMAALGGELSVPLPASGWFMAWAAGWAVARRRRSGRRLTSPNVASNGKERS